MALTATWDLVRDGEVEQSLLNGGRIVRTGIVGGITTAGSVVSSSQNALLDAIAGAPGIKALGDTFNATYPSYICVHTVARGIPGTGGKKAWVWQHFETPGGGGTPLERFAIEWGGALISEPTEIMPASGIPILCTVNELNPNYAGDDDPETRPITVGFPRVMRSFVLYGLFADQPPGEIFDASNTVNDAPWLGYEVGCVRQEVPRVRYSSRDGMFAVSVGFLSKGSTSAQDWKTFAIPRKVDGELARPDASLLADLLATPYTTGIINDSEGLWCGGMYGMSNMIGLYGDSFPIGD